MDALGTAFVAAALAAWGQQAPVGVAFLAARSGRPGVVLAGLFSAALVSNLVAALAGDLVAQTITVQAMTLLVAVALIFAGVAGLIRRSAPPLGSTRTPLFLAALLLILAGELGGRPPVRT